MQLAQVTNPIAPNLSPGTTSQGVEQFGNILAVIIRTLLIAGVLFFFFIFIIGGIRWIISGGDKTQIESARNTILNAVIGLVVLFALFAILQLIEILFDVSILQIDFGALRIS